MKTCGYNGGSFTEGGCKECGSETVRCCRDCSDYLACQLMHRECRLAHRGYCEYFKEVKTNE